MTNIFHSAVFILGVEQGEAREKLPSIKQETSRTRKAFLISLMGFAKMMASDKELSVSCKNGITIELWRHLQKAPTIIRKFEISIVVKYIFAKYVKL